MGKDERRPANLGFAAANFEGIQLRRSQTISLLEGDTYPGIDKEIPRQREVVIKQLPGIVLGRRLDPALANKTWRKFIDTTASASGPNIEGLPTRDLYVSYLSQAEHDNLIRAYAQRHDNPRKTQKDLARELRGDLDLVQNLFRKETESERRSLDHTHHSDGKFDRERASWDSDYVDSYEERGFGSWQPAMFEASDRPLSEGVSGIISVCLTDPEGQLQSGRSRAIDILCSALRLDTNILTSNWDPEFGILRSAGRRSRTTKLRVSSMPLDVMLKPPSVSINM